VADVTRPGPTVRVKATISTPEGDRVVEDRVAAEEPLELRLASPGQPASRAWVTLRTPGHDFELAAGWVVHEGLARPDEVARVAYCTDEDLSPEQAYNVVTVTCAVPVVAPHRHDSFGSGSAACGVCGKDSLEAAMTVPRGPRWSGTLPAASVIRELPEVLRSRQPAFDLTGGIHAAGAFDAQGRALVVREDIGRHNAVDKVTGARVLAGDASPAPLLVLSGRAGFELVQKAVTAGYAGVVSVGAASSLAVALAEQAGVALWGFTRPDRCVRYC